jgi:uncharacterized phage protein (predicted DNA packaging)
MLVKRAKEYLRINHTRDDDYIRELVELAKDLIRTKTGIAYKREDTIYTQAILMCVAHYYDNRTSVIDKAVTVIPYTLNELIKTIAFRGEYDK